MHRTGKPVTALAVALLAVVVTGGPTASTSSTSLPHDRSGLPWASGVYVPKDDVAGYETFGAWRGAPPDVALTYTGREYWDQIIDPVYLYKAWRNTRQRLVISTAMIPEQGGATLAACARGEYDAKWRRFGRGLASNGLANRSVIRLGWEFNGLWVPWAATNPRHYAACWRRIHRSVEIAAPGLLWDWCVNRGVTSARMDPRKAYPGDRYVDIVGVDAFDGYPPATTANGWRQQHDAKYGLKFWADFARDHGKGFSVPEWAVYPGTSWAGAGGGDNPHYIARMFRFFRQNADILAYEIYFNEDDPYQGGALHLNPLSAEEYRRQVARTLSSNCRTCVRPMG